MATFPAEGQVLKAVLADGDVIPIQQTSFCGVGSFWPHRRQFVPLPQILQWLTKFPVIPGLRPGAPQVRVRGLSERATAWSSENDASAAPKAGIRAWRRLKIVRLRQPRLMQWPVFPFR